MRRAVAMVDVPVALARPVDAIGPVQAGVEPLRRVGRGHLRRQHEAMLVVEGEGVGLAVEVAALPAPVGPGAGHAMEDVSRAGLAAEALVGRQRGERVFVRHRTPQPLGHVGLGDLLQAPRDAGAPEILLRDHIGRDLRPRRRHFDAAMLEDDRAVGIADFGIASTERHPFEWRLSCSRKPALQAHHRSPVPNSRYFVRSRGALSEC